MKGHKANTLAASLLGVQSSPVHPESLSCGSAIHLTQSSVAGQSDSLTLGIRCLELANEACHGVEERKAVVPKELTLASTAVEHGDQRISRSPDSS